MMIKNATILVKFNFVVHVDAKSEKVAELLAQDVVHDLFDLDLQKATLKDVEKLIRQNCTLELVKDT